jgi:CelD/BcsL family acetyltransferase involved in cellulose biosynthesis
VTQIQFLDYHQPLADAEIQGPVRQGRYAGDVVRGEMICDTGNPIALPYCEPAPYIDWSEFAGFEEYKTLLLERRKGMVRDRERRRRALAADYGELCFAMNDPGDDVFACARLWKSRQLRETGHDDYFAKPETMEFLAALRERKRLVSSTLRAGGRLVSLWIGFVHEGCWSGWIFAYDPEFRKYSAGHQLLFCMLEESCRRGHREFDFSIGGEDYKMIYATRARLLGPIGKPPLDQALADAAKNVLRRRSPVLFQAAKRLKRKIKDAAQQRVSRQEKR